MHNKYKIERATPQFDRRGSTTTIETSFNVSPENIQPKLDSVDLKSVKANPNIKSSSGMENVEANHLSSVAVTSNNLPKFPNTPSLNLGVPDAGEPNHGYVSVFYNAAGAGGRKPSMPISRALVSTEDKTGAGADYPDSAPYSGSGILNKNKYGTSGKTEIISFEANRDNFRSDNKNKQKNYDKKNNDKNNHNNQDDIEQKNDQSNQGSSHENQQSDQSTNQTDWPGSKISSGDGPIQKSTLTKVHCLDASKEGSGRKTTISENGSASGNNGGGNGAMSIEDVYKKLKSMMILMVGIIGFLIVLFLLMIVIFAALIASTNSKMENLENENTEQKAKIEELELKIQNSSNEDLLNQVKLLTARIEVLENHDLNNRMQEIESKNLPDRVDSLENSIGITSTEIADLKTHVSLDNSSLANIHLQTKTDSQFKMNDLSFQIGGFNSSLFQMNGTIKDIRLEVDTLTTNMDDIQDFEIPLMKIDIANSKTNIENLKTRVTQLEDFHA